MVSVEIATPYGQLTPSERRGIALALAALADDIVEGHNVTADQTRFHLAAVEYR
jgi:hypothetical protein